MIHQVMHQNMNFCSGVAPSRAIGKKIKNGSMGQHTQGHHIGHFRYVWFSYDYTASNSVGYFVRTYPRLD